jgi:GrpB-like predicted nucleotidyltransferase (UPF0157 family)
MMRLTSVITSYDERWPEMYARTAELLRPIFGETLTAVHHVGSTAVPGLAAKPEIDVLAIVTGTRDAENWTRALATAGYRRGCDLSAGHLFFKRDENGVRTHKLHVCVEHHSTAVKMLQFRDHLRNCSEDRDRYAALKLSLQAENTSGIGEYLEKKAPFIRSVLAGLTEL